MARKKSAVLARTKTARKASDKHASNHQNPEVEAGDHATGNQPASPSVPEFPKTAPMEPGTHSSQLSNCPASSSSSRVGNLDNPEDLASQLDSLELAGSPVQDDIVLEDPPGDSEGLEEDIQHFRSLADPPSEAEERYLEGGSGTESAEEVEDQTNMEDKNKKLMNTQQIPKDEANQMISALDNFIKTSEYGHGKDRRSHLGHVTLSRLTLMTMTLRLRCGMDWGIVLASEVAAVSVGRGKWAARKTREWIRNYQELGELPVNIYGTWNDSVIEDEDLSSAIRAYLTKKGKYVYARDIIDFFGTPEADDFVHLLDLAPCLRTCQRWMIRMGYTWRKEKRGQFVDGHEREDVVDYRMNKYIPEWIKLEPRMRSWTKEGIEIPRNLREGERGVVVWFHDESTFYAHDRRLTRWVHESETPMIYKKGEGVSLMVADFVSADYGWLRLGPCDAEGLLSTPGDEIFEDARVIFRAGKNRDGWFGTDDVVQQLSRAMAIVKKRYPNEDHVFIFDNATIHTKLPGDAPNVSKMTLGPSQKVKGEESGPNGEKIKVDMAPAILADGSVQQLYHPVNHPIKELRGAFKGLKTLLEERGIPGARQLRLHCPPTDSHKTHGCLPGATSCCARQTMLSQPDFLNQKSTLQLLAESQDCSVIYLPKYHCELNPIEQCWGAAKRVYRDCPTSSSEADLRRNMLAALESVKLQSIRNFAGRSRRFVHAYQRGLSSLQEDWTKKTYHGHRVLSEGVMQTFDEPSSHPVKLNSSPLVSSTHLGPRAQHPRPRPGGVASPSCLPVLATCGVSSEGVE